MTKLKSDPSGREDAELGSAVLLALLASSLLAAIGLALAGLAAVETGVAASERAGRQLALAAETAAELAVADLLTIPNLTDILTGAAPSRLRGHAIPPVGPGEPPLTLVQLTAAVQADYSALGSWGANSPRWRVFAHGLVTELSPAISADNDDFVAVFAADDVDEQDGDPVTDTNDRIQLMACAMNRRGARRSILITAGKTNAVMANGLPGVQVVSWKELR